MGGGPVSGVLETPTFKAFPKLARLNRDVVITEKIDGTNACVGVLQDGTVWAQSRKRVITPEEDNFGFASWVRDNEDALRDLGPGYHYGEWWGLGIQRGYGLDHKQFSLFNPDKELSPRLEGVVHHVPVVARHGRMESSVVEDALAKLARDGSIAAPGFDNPEGIVVYHTAARVSFKVTLEADELPKSLAVAA